MSGVRTGIFSFWATMVRVVIGVVLVVVGLAVVVALGGGLRRFLRSGGGGARKSRISWRVGGGNDIWVGTGKVLEFAL